MNLKTKQFSVICGAMVLLLTFFCSNANPNVYQIAQKANKPVQIENSGTSVSDGVAEKLETAKKAGKAVFLVVTGNGITETDKALAVAKNANLKNKNVVIIQMNRDDASNTDLVKKFGLSGAPLPLILVISPKGFPTGGYILSQATAENISALVPSPKLDEIYEAINGSKPVFLVISKKSYIDRIKLIENCKSAVNQLQNKGAVIEVDISDAKETAFIKQLNLKNTTNTSTVLVLNTSGQTTGVFEGKADPVQLVQAANKVIKSGGCCPGGSGSSCGPKK